MVHLLETLELKAKAADTDWKGLFLALGAAASDTAFDWSMPSLCRVRLPGKTEAL